MSVGSLRVGVNEQQVDIQEIQQVKGVTASIIDNLELLSTTNPEANRCLAIAKTKYEEACMWAVRGIARAAQPQDYIVPTAHDPAA